MVEKTTIFLHRWDNKETIVWSAVDVSLIKGGDQQYLQGQWVAKLTKANSQQLAKVIS